MKRHKPTKLPKIRRILILCEGESEVIYLNGFRVDRRLQGVSIEIYQPNNFSPLGLLKEAKRKIKEAQKDKLPYERVWIVFDKDAHAGIPQTFHEAQEANIHIAFSLVSFEQWVLLHFEKSNQYFAMTHDVVRYIEKHHLANYGKTQPYSILKPHLPIALNNAKWLHQQNSFELENDVKPYELQAYTDIDKLILSLEKL
jgi:RloB-like protein